MASYEPVLRNENEEDPDGVYTIDDDDDEPEHVVFVDEDDTEFHQDAIEPLEIEGCSLRSDEEGYSYGRDLPLFKEPWLASCSVTIFFVTPVLLGNIITFYDLVGRIWVAAPFCLHLTASLATARYSIPNAVTPDKVPSRIVTSLAALLDIILFGIYGYELIYSVLIQFFFTEIDGTDVVEYTYYKERLQLFYNLGLTVVGCRVLIGGTAIALRFADYAFPATCQHWCRPPRLISTYFARAAWTQDSKERFQRVLRRVLTGMVVLSTMLALWSLFSIAAHWIPWPTPVVRNSDCDPLDETECALPFPSYHQMVPDSSTPTGYRVNLKSHVLPPLKGGIRMEPTFLNHLDGFSTMAPMLFYITGMKEAHENRNSTARTLPTLQGPFNIQYSTTPQSITLLLDVDGRKLVSHSAEIDYLDRDRPLVMVFPAQPLKHGSHYAVAVINASDEHGKRLPPTPGMVALLKDEKSNRQKRYKKLVIPTLEFAAPWFSSVDLGSLQLLFDFTTVSEDYQLGPIRAVRDATLAHIQAPEWGSWKSHVRVNSIIDNDCREADALIARTVHAELDIPWFLADYGPGQRGAFLDEEAITSGRPTTLGTGKFVVHIPCSVRAAALDEPEAKPIRAFVEYGHGLFYNRDEASDSFLQQIAYDNGYVIMAMDWRGMSSYDLLLVARVLLSTPRLFQAVRDNLIQGYANKYALQHFAQNEMLAMDWFRFQSDQGAESFAPTLDDKGPVSIFYGISQGGILGAGYLALSGATGLIERGILGVPGAPFALIMTRSLEFQGYDALLLLNFYNNRHVRILLSLVQMAWDPTEGGGTLAIPVRETFPRMLLQAGLGDATVPTIAAEALARGLGAVTLPNNPREIFGIPVAKKKGNPQVTLTELLFEAEYLALPEDDMYADRNSVHYCVRKDEALINQMEEFINTGKVIDPCAKDSCHREHADC